jgi:tetratricopeptide (TPR) repeat protein
MVARTSAYQFKGQQLDVREIGRRLNANALVEGSVRASSNRLRIIVQLADAAKGKTLWSGSYDRQARDPFTVQQELSRTLSGEIGGHFGHQLPSDTGSDDPPDAIRMNPEDEEYLAGRHFARRYTMGDYESAIECYHQVIAKEPDYARTYSDLARCYVMLPFFKAMLSSELIPKIRTSASKALEIDGSLGEAHVASAVPLIYDFDWSAAGMEFRKAVSRNSSHAASHAGMGAACVQKGSYTRGIAELETAETLTPGPGRVRVELAYAYAVSGNREKAKEILNEFLDRFDPDSFPAVMIATVYIGLGDKRRAFEWLHKAIDQKDLAVFLKSDPLYDPLRSDARFAALLKRTNLS